MRKQLGLVAAMEEEQLNSVRSEVAAEPAADSLETDLIEITDEAAEGDSVIDQVEEAEEVSEALESLYEVLSASLEKGGVGKHSAQITNIAVEHMCKRVGIKKAHMPALEAFADTSSRVKATKLAMENISQKLKQIWLAIVHAIRTAINWVKTFFAKMFDAGAKLEARGNALYKVVQSAASENVNVVDNETLAAGLSFSTGGAQGLVTGSHNLKLSGEEVAKAIVTEMKSRYDTIASMVESFDPKDSKKFADAVRKSRFYIDPSMTKLSNPTALGFEVPEGGTVYRDRELPGNATIILTVPAEDAEPFDRAINTTYKFGKFNPNAKEVTETKLPTVNTGQMGEIVKNVISLAKDIKGCKVSIDALSAVSERVAKSAEKIAGIVETLEGEAKKDLHDIQRLLAAMPKQINNVIPPFCAYGLKTGKMYLDYVELSMKQAA